MKNKEFVLEQVNKTKKVRFKIEKARLYTEGEIASIKKSLENWDKADEEYNHEESYKFLLETIKVHIRNYYKKRNPSRLSVFSELEEIEIVELCYLDNDSKSSRVIIYNTDKNTLEDAVDDFIGNFKQERVVEIKENFTGICVKSEVTAVMWC